MGNFIGEKIHMKRKEEGLSIIQLANKLNVTNKEIILWENNIKVPNIDMLMKMADVLYCDVDYFSSGEKCMNINKQNVDLGGEFVEEQDAVDLFYDGIEIVEGVESMTSIARFIKLFSPYKIYKDTLYLYDDASFFDKMTVNSDIAIQLIVAVHAINRDIINVKTISKRIFQSFNFKRLIRIIINNKKISITMLKEIYLKGGDDELFCKHLEILDVMGYITIDDKTKNVTSNITKEKYEKIYGESCGVY